MIGKSGPIGLLGHETMGLLGDVIKCKVCGNPHSPYWYNDFGRMLVLSAYCPKCKVVSHKTIERNND